MEKYLLCLMGLVDLSVNHSVSESRRNAAQNCAYYYKQYLAYSVCTGGYEANSIEANSYKESALKQADLCRINLYFKEV
jgi:hypothetical protein